LEHFGLSGKTALVTGAARGLGEVAAGALAKAGADVAVCGRSRPGLERVGAAIRELGVRARGFELDVLSKDEVRSAVEKITAGLGPIGILVNNAGVNHRAPVLEHPEEQGDRIIGANRKGCFLVAQAAAPGASSSSTSPPSWAAGAIPPSWRASSLARPSTSAAAGPPGRGGGPC